MCYNGVSEVEKMKYGIIMTVHDNPKQLKRLCKMLVNDNAYFFIHVDKKSDINLFRESLKEIPRVKLISTNKVYWADISQVDATIDLLKEAVEAKMDYIFFISGQDYLIKKDNNLLKYVDINKNYMEYFELPNYNWGTDGRCNRYCFYHNIVNANGIVKFNPRNRYYKFINRVLLKVQKIFHIKRKFIKNLKPYSGANWFNINLECAQYILNNYKKIYKYFKFVQFPDEMFIQTIVLNSNFKNYTINETLRYVDWYTGPEQPRTLTFEDFDNIIKSKAIFCRKLDETKDKKIFNLLDKYRSSE